MKYNFVPIIVVICYGLGEIYKVIFIKNKKMYNLLPIVLTFIGVFLNLFLHMLDDVNIYNLTILWDIIQTGMISGASSTGANQIIKQIYKLKGEKYED